MVHRLARFGNAGEQWRPHFRRDQQRFGHYRPTAGDANNYYVIASNSQGTITSSVITVTVANNGSLAFWDFNGSFDINTPASANGAGTASLVNGVAGFASLPHRSARWQ